MITKLLPLITMLLLLPAGRPSALGAGTGASLHRRVVLGGTSVHVWHPGGYAPDRAGLVIWVAPPYLDADAAWARERLAARFADSRKQALFLVVPADAAARPDAGALVDAALRAAEVARPVGPGFVAVSPEVAAAGRAPTDLLPGARPLAAPAAALPDVLARTSLADIW